MKTTTFFDILNESLTSKFFKENKTVCGIEKEWISAFKKHVEDPNFHPGKIKNPKEPNSTMLLVSEKSWNTLISVFEGGPKLDVFIIDQVPDFEIIEIFVCKNDPIDNPIWTKYIVSKNISVKALREYLCVKEEIYSDKARLRVIDENQSGTVAFKAISEEFLVRNAGIATGTKVSIANFNKRVVRFVESDEEADCVFEICGKVFNSTCMQYLDSAFYFLLFGFSWCVWF